MKKFTEQEGDYVIEMMKGNYKDFKKRDIIKPFFLKTEHTLKAVYAEMQLGEVVEKLVAKYKEVRIFEL